MVDVSVQVAGPPPVSGAPASPPPELEAEPPDDEPVVPDDPDELLFVTPIARALVPLEQAMHDRLRK